MIQVELIRIEYANTQGYLAYTKDDGDDDFAIYTLPSSISSSLVVFSSLEAAQTYFSDAEVVITEGITVNNCLLELSACYHVVNRDYLYLFLSVYNITRDAANALDVLDISPQESEAFRIFDDYLQIQVNPNSLAHLFEIIKVINIRLALMTEEYVAIGLEP